MSARRRVYVLKITRPVVRCRHRKYIWRQWRHQTYQRRLRENSIRRRNILHWCNKELRRQNVTTIKWWLDGETVRPMQTRVNNVQTQQDVGHLWTWSHLQGAYSQYHYLLVVEYVQLKRLLTNRVDDKKVNAVAIRLRFTPSCKNSWLAIFTSMI